MASNISFRFTKGLISQASTPLNGSYYVLGGVETDVDEILAIGSNQLISVSYGPAGASSGNLQAIEIYASQNCTLTTNGTGTADVQTISITDTPTGGTFPLIFNGQVAAGLAYNSSASAIQTALQALSSIGSGNVTCSGGPLPGTPVVCTFAGSLATGRQPIMLTGSGGLTGGSSPTVSVAHTTSGTPQDTIAISAGIPICWDISGIFASPFFAAVSAWYITCATALRLQARILTL